MENVLFLSGIEEVDYKVSDYNKKSFMESLRS